jgi:rhamnosyltransferase
MGAPRVSICLPTWNGERHLARLLPALARQAVAGGCEIVAIDSNSQDRSRALLEQAGARVETIPQREFGHGRTRNRIAALARGEVLVFLSQDALPQGDGFLARLVAPFEDARTAAVGARILPHDDDDALTRRSALAAPEASDQPAVFEVGPGERWESLAPAERLRRSRLNDVASAIRAARLADLPFPDVAFGEDAAWAARALQAHRYGPGAAYRRNRVDAAFLRAEFGLCVRPGPVSVARGVLHELREDLRFVARHGGWGALLRAPGLRTAQVLGQRAGSR